MKIPEKIEMPAATAWPLVLAFGFTLVFAGFVTAAVRQHSRRDVGCRRRSRLVPGSSPHGIPGVDASCSRRDHRPAVSQNGCAYR